MASTEPAVQSTTTITSYGMHTFEHGLGSWDVHVDLVDAVGMPVAGVRYSAWSPDVVRVEVHDVVLPAELRVTA